MENINLSSRDKLGHHHRSIGNLHVLLPSHRQTSHHSHRQRLTLTTGTNVSPLLDLVTFSCLFIGNHHHRQLPCRPVTGAPSCRSILYRSLGTCPKTVSTRRRGSVVKHTDQSQKEKKKCNPNSSPFVYGLLPKLLGPGRTIYTWELYVVIVNI